MEIGLLTVACLPFEGSLCFNSLSLLLIIYLLTLEWICLNMFKRAMFRRFLHCVIRTSISSCCFKIECEIYVSGSSPRVRCDRSRETATWCWCRRSSSWTRSTTGARTRPARLSPYIVSRSPSKTNPARAAVSPAASTRHSHRFVPTSLFH